MGFGKPVTQKPKLHRAEPVRPLTSALVRIVILAVLATFGAAYGIYLYYTHAFRPKPRPQTVDSGEVEIQLQ